MTALELIAIQLGVEKEFELVVLAVPVDPTLAQQLGNAGVVTPVSKFCEKSETELQKVVNEVALVQVLLSAPIQTLLTQT